MLSAIKMNLNLPSLFHLLFGVCLVIRPPLPVLISKGSIIVGGVSNSCHSHQRSLNIVISGSICMSNYQTRELDDSLR